MHVQRVRVVVQTAADGVPGGAVPGSDIFIVTVDLDVAGSEEPTTIASECVNGADVSGKNRPACSVPAKDVEESAAGEKRAIVDRQRVNDVARSAGNSRPCLAVPAPHEGVRTVVEHAAGIQVASVGSERIHMAARRVADRRPVCAVKGGDAEGTRVDGQTEKTADVKFRTRSIVVDGARINFTIHAGERLAGIPVVVALGDGEPGWCTEKCERKKR